MRRQFSRWTLCGLLAAALVAPMTGTALGLYAFAGDPQCAVPARSFTDITFLLSSVPPATPPATTAGATLERGTPATEAERRAMRAVIEEWLACQNEGNLFSAWALFSDAYLYRLLLRQPSMTEAVYEDWATPRPVEGESATLLEISGERRLDDGRLGATVRIRYAAVPMPKQFFFYFVDQDGTLLIDSILGEISFSVP